jgi:hypothetical protein
VRHADGRCRAGPRRHLEPALVAALRRTQPALRLLDPAELEGGAQRQVRPADAIRSAKISASTRSAEASRPASQSADATW